MKNKYTDIMNRIRVTDDMRSRIVENLNLERDEKLKRVLNYRRYISLVACIFLVFIAGLSIKNIVYDKNDDGLLSDNFEIKEHDNLKALSKAVGFKVKAIDDLALKSQEVKYISIGKKISEISYLEAENTFTFRMAKSKDDISGDYNFYSDIEKVKVGKKTIILKGNDGGYNLAVWQEKKFSYSLSSEKALSKSEMLNILEAIK